MAKTMKAPHLSIMARPQGLILPRCHAGKQPGECTNGLSVASAGDVNGDGYSDVIVGAPDYDNGETDEGAAFTYHGSATGINITAAAMLKATRQMHLWAFGSRGGGCKRGWVQRCHRGSLWQYDNGENDEGAAFVYHGSATGISTTAAAMVESNQASANMGISVAGAGM
jgi:hypothetical protein